MTILCVVSGCHRQQQVRSMCNGHYRRWLRHGDPTKGQRSVRGDAEHFVREIALRHTGNACLIWPFRRDRYGYARMGRSTIVSRYVCTLAHGNPPTTAHEAAHSCGNGHLGCVHPGHLSWKTTSSNQMDRLRHGTDHRGSKHGMAKLTEHQVLAIWQLKGSQSQQSVADKFGISRQQVSRIHRGEDWSWLTKGQRVWLGAENERAA